MPRGTPKAGFRKTKNSAEKVSAIKVEYSAVSNETDAEIEQRLAERFDILDTLAEACTVGNARSLIVSGPAGLGKSYTVEERLKKFDPNEINHTIAKGYVRATGLDRGLRGARGGDGRQREVPRRGEYSALVVGDEALVFDDEDTKCALIHPRSVLSNARRAVR